MKRQLVWKACADDAWRIKRFAQAIENRLRWSDTGSPEEIATAHKVTAYAHWLMNHYEALSRELD